MHEESRLEKPAFDHMTPQMYWENVGERKQISHILFTHSACKGILHILSSTIQLFGFPLEGTE